MNEKKSLDILVLSENRETKSIYQSFGIFGDHNLHFGKKEKSVINLILIQKFDLIIVEIMHPVMNEIEFIDMIADTVKEIPIIVVSAFFYDTKEIVFGNKISAFILKPVDVEKLLNALKTIFKTGVSEKSKPKSEDKISEEKKRISVLLEISRVISSKTSLTEILNSIVELSSELLKAERSTVFLIDEEKNEFWSKAALGLKESIIRFPIGKGIAGEVVRKEKVMNIADVNSNPYFNKEINKTTGYETRNLLAVPIRNIEGKIIGVFEALNKIEGFFTVEDEEYLKSIAASTGVAIENAYYIKHFKDKLNSINNMCSEYVSQRNNFLMENKLDGLNDLIGQMKNAASQKSREGINTSESLFKYSALLLQNNENLLNGIIKNLHTD